MDIILQGIGTFLGWLSAGSHSYIVALLIFAVILEAVMLPFGIKQQKNSIRQAKLRPKEMVIRKKYAGRDDKVTQQKMQAEIQELYARENYNPMSGCLPLLVQFPILIFLYQIVVNPLKYVICMTDGAISAIVGVIQGLGSAASVGYTINTGSTIGVVSFINNPENLSAVQAGLAAGGHEGALAELNSAVANGLPNFGIGGLDLGGTPSFNPINILIIIPIVTFVAYFISMKLNRKFSFQPMAAADNAQAGCSNKMMDYMMPLLSVWISFSVPAVVGVYWIIKSLLGTLKQFLLARAMPLPACTEEDIKAAEKELNARAPKTRVVSNKAPRIDKYGNPIRSLHHIDDDDYDENGKFIEKKPEPENTDEASKSADASEAPKAADTDVKADAETAKNASSLMNGVSMKDDKKPTKANKKSKSQDKTDESK